jgi:diacylglycerol kinase family enzyme
MEFNMETFFTDSPNKHVKLIFNPGSGASNESPPQLLEVIKELQSWRLIPEIYIIKPNCDLSCVVRDAISQGINMFVVCGGDGTVCAVARELSEKNSTLGIIPTGTQNNVAFSLKIPTDIPNAVALLRNGNEIKIDVGVVSCGDTVTPFLEVCSVGLFSTLFPSGDDIQHGKLSRIGDFMATLVTSPPAEFHLLLDNGQEVTKTGHVLLISNMPYIIRHYEVASKASFNDGLLDILFFAGVSKLDLVGYALKGTGMEPQEDPRFEHFRVRRVDIETDPVMPVMADGIALGEGRISIEVQKLALTVIVAASAAKEAENSGGIHGK